MTVAREDEASLGGWGLRYTWTSPPVLTALDGSFRVAGLPPGSYGVRAYRPGGGEAVVSHVALGDHPTLTIHPTGVLAGVVIAASGAPITDVVVAAQDREHEVSRDERAYFTGGRFALRDLPAGSYKLTVDGDPGSALIVPLGEGERREDLRLVIQPRYALHGRLVSQAGAPLVAWRIEVPRLESVDHGPGPRVIETSTVEIAVTAADGTFLVHDLPAGPTTISAFDVTRGADVAAALVHDLTLGGTASLVEVGDLATPTETARAR